MTPPFLSTREPTVWAILWWISYGIRGVEVGIGAGWFTLSPPRGCLDGPVAGVSVWGDQLVGESGERTIAMSS